MGKLRRAVEVDQRSPVRKTHREDPHSFSGETAVPATEFFAQSGGIGAGAAEKTAGFQSGERRRALADHGFFGHW